MSTETQSLKSQSWESSGGCDYLIIEKRTISYVLIQKQADPNKEDWRRPCDPS